MAILGLYFKQRVRFGIGASAETLPFGAIELDASISETHTADNDVTQFPVESGVDITDHVRRQPDRVTIRGVVSNDPLGLFGGGLRLDRSIDAYQVVRDMVDEAQLIDVVTSLRTYSNMVIESLSVPRDSKRGQAVEMTLEMREIKTAQVAAVAGTSDLGTQNTTVVS